MSDATAYARLSVEVEALLVRCPGTPQIVSAYMIARLALLAVRAIKGPHAAAEMAYKLADEFAGERNA